jgi:hypothetical protein
MDMIVLVTVDGLTHGATNGIYVKGSSWIKYCFNMHTIDKQLQLVVLFVSP